MAALRSRLRCTVRSECLRAADVRSITDQLQGPEVITTPSQDKQLSNATGGSCPISLVAGWRRLQLVEMFVA